ncbi:von Willebrand factor type A domain-containing protein [Succinivibrio dextrinosolvens DSM 3072]|uniref:von Willebrand factor type A domain-containing protein n=1 Tax=Succinivibrio dextrinosolvens DSM 3072 TaxID=1123324 RepID=A0A1T4VMM1_9GAMM|nr:VWA domain-containing protein [Succinivibrio dextrinosolvens]SKA66210.1 von Willebrand factor type A domain-containing protein [Succinivibrio dextrinosolvens DSM 3072]
MLRIVRVYKTGVSDDLMSFSFVSKKWQKELLYQLNINTYTVFAQPIIDEDYVNFVTSVTGNFDYISEQNSFIYNKELKQYDKDLSEILSFLQSNTKLNDQSLNSTRETLIRILKSLDKKYIFEKRNIVSVPLVDETKKPVIVPPPIPKPITTSVIKERLNLKPFFPILPLLLLIFLGLYKYLDDSEEKCILITAENNKPQFELIIDSSSSMIESYGTSNRITLAKAAAKELIRTLDPKITVGLIDVNGCPKAKYIGEFPFAKRNNLINSIENLTPPQTGGTPLVDALRKLSSNMDGVNSEAIGIIITDGEDSCEFANHFQTNPIISSCILTNNPDLNLKDVCQDTENDNFCKQMKVPNNACALGKESAKGCTIITNRKLCYEIKDIFNSHCEVSKEIHKRQPKLKIHTIMIGSNYDISCISKNTGGEFFTAKNATELIHHLKKAGANLQKVCE